MIGLLSSDNMTNHIINFDGRRRMTRLKICSGEKLLISHFYNNYNNLYHNKQLFLKDWTVMGRNINFTYKNHYTTIIIYSTGSTGFATANPDPVYDALFYVT